jgi:small-conductance mechanosensitive channel
VRFRTLRRKVLEVLVCMQIRTAILFPAALLLSAAAPPPATAPLRPADVLAHIQASINWYRLISSAEQTPPLASDVLLRDSTHAAAVKAVQLAFQFGQASATFLDTPGSAAAGPAQSRSLSQSAARAAARVESLQTRIKDLDASLQTARGSALATLRAERNTIQAELALATEVRDTVNTLAAFTPAAGSGGLGPEVQELERLVPEAAPGHAASARAASSATLAGASAYHSEPAGIFGLSAALFGLSHNHSQLRQTMSGTDSLARSLERLRTPLVDEVRGVVARSETLSTISGSEDAQQLAAGQHEIETLTARFHQLSAVLVPLGEQNIVLGTVRGNLAQALDGIDAQSSETGRSLLLRVGMLGLAIGTVVLLSALWRRITFRYVRDARRRTQFLTLRRLAVTCSIAIIVVLSFVTEFGSLATYAGLLTAGIAVALQNVILSVVAYFFLIGRYGVRSGDRVTISGVTGKVIDIGLVRIYLAELTASGGEFHPTGRIVVYSNSVLFQPSAMFKHMSETDYVWHTVRLVLTPESDVHLAESRIAKAVETAYQDYGQSIEKQHSDFERAVDTPLARPRPDVRLHYTEEGIEVRVLYPAQTQQAPAADKQMMQAIEAALTSEPKLALANAGTPRVVATAA